MKKITFMVMAMFLSLTFYPTQSNATTTKTDAHAAVIVLNPVDAAKVKALELRLDEINELDKTNMKSAEKRELRKEVRSIKKQVSDLGGGVYVSVGALILILVLLIILL